MKNVAKGFFEILLSGLYNTPLEKSYENWGSLFQLAQAHSVENIFYYAIQDRSDVPAEVKEKAKRQYWNNVLQQVSQDYYAEEIFCALEQANVPYMPLKGYYLRKLYPAPELRTSCDVDFFYEASRTNDVRKIMKAQEFEEDKGGPNHSVWTKGGITFEPHFYLLSDNDKFHDYYKDVWSRLKTENGSVYSFTDEDFYIFFIVHAAKHFAHGGFGVRTVLDVYIYNKEKELDREYLNGEFEKLGLNKFVTVIENLSKCWFGGEEMNEDMRHLSAYIIESGTYGVSLHKVMLNNVKEQSVKGSKLSYLLQTLFLPYKQMKIRYPILQKMPILLPFYWVKRWFGVLFKRRERIKNTVNTMQAITSDEVAKYSRILEITEVPLD